eukprot:gnl/Dysnectes_brevis/2335_a2751_772.p1 GENE.gnl/Dysnectes_brevis/2335_a2751_772~~gnl/Dysnectes_brevis/2335_a2751_772.p1  ORF type:complete len:553 (+),score=165.82 gnl/Dysnectes_brevis/2335_a2751_772:106-1764(+)
MEKYLIHLKPRTRDRLYRLPWCCSVVFWLLPSLSQQIVLRSLSLSLIEGEEHADLDLSILKDWTWPSSNARNAIRLALKPLLQFQVLQLIETEHNTFIRFDRTFLLNIASSLTPTDQPQLPGVSPDPLAGLVKVLAVTARNQDKEADTQHKRNQEFQDTWQSLSSITLGLSGTRTATGPDPRLIMEALGFTRGKKPTHKGHQFVLGSKRRQVWLLLEALLEYLHSPALTRQAQRLKGVTQRLSELSPEDLLAIILRLVTLQPLRPYILPPASAVALPALGIMQALGLLRVVDTKRKGLAVRVSELLTGLASRTGALNVIREDGFIITESTCWLYAYTAAPTHIRVISMFAEMRYRLPDMSAFILTRDSVVSGIESGLTAADIARYLQENAHPASCRSRPEFPLPPTVTNLLSIWETEGRRLTVKERAVEYSFLTGLSDRHRVRFHLACQVAEKEKLLLWRPKADPEVEKAAHLVLALLGQENKYLPHQQIEQRHRARQILDKYYETHKPVIVVREEAMGRLEETVKARGDQLQQLGSSMAKRQQTAVPIGFN